METHSNESKPDRIEQDGSFDTVGSIETNVEDGLPWLQWATFCMRGQLQKATILASSTSSESLKELTLNSVIWKPTSWLSI